MATKNPGPKKASKKAARTATKKIAKRKIARAMEFAIHSPPCGPDEVEFDDVVTGKRMCKKALR